ncbi:MAG: tRNA (adenosine(37)-N6)-threonylcarbamoyltransferase complex dimerization subunit type 1 TsaB [candidate division Zixibacteria bacterium]|nr:tRNA (adenosine(37)-N6)-threonylcarbamoyltransferase complex dimerization subunit type 1 TsaB [candidate division Zixibacteria bacterium]
MILGIDTSGKNLGLALCNDGEILSSSLTSPGLRHGEIIQQMTGDFLKDSGVGFSDITGISVALGPGSFTGLRIGLAAAKGCSYASQNQLAGISTLLAGAFEFANCERKVVSIIDARRDEVYWAAFDCAGDFPKRLVPDSAASLSDLRKITEDNAIFSGPSHLAERFKSDVGSYEYRSNDKYNLAIPASVIGEKDINNGKNLDLASAVPIYIRSDF